MNITEVLVQPQAMAWLPWAVQYFFLHRFCLRCRYFVPNRTVI